MYFDYIMALLGTYPTEIMAAFLKDMKLWNSSKFPLGDWLTMPQSSPGRMGDTIERELKRRSRN